MKPRTQRTTWWVVSTAVAIAAIAGSYAPRPAAQTKKPRWNRIIEKLEQGEPAIAGEARQFDMEHGSFSFDRLETFLAENAKEKDANGIPLKTPSVRIGMDAREVPDWVIAQVLDAGVLALRIPSVETKAQVVNIVKAMRYPPQRGWSNARYPEPLGVRGPTSRRAATYWGESNPVEYSKRADVWPLNPDGELFLIASIESVAGARNVKDILTAPGLGAILLAPNDLSYSMGIGQSDRIGAGGITLPAETEQVYDQVLTECEKQTKVACGAADATEALRKKHNIRFQ